MALLISQSNKNYCSIFDYLVHFKTIKTYLNLGLYQSVCLQVFPSHNHLHGHVPAADVWRYEQRRRRVCVPRVQSQDDARVRCHLGRGTDASRCRGGLHSHSRHVITPHDSTYIPLSTLSTSLRC